jgi:hypothetical protein
MKPNRTQVIVGVVVVIILAIVGYYAFAHQTEPSVPSVATSTAPSATSTVAASSSATVTPAPATGSAPTVSDIQSSALVQSPDFTVAMNTANARVGSTFPQIVVSLPKGSNGKILVMTLRPTNANAGATGGVLLATTVNTTAQKYAVSGLSLTQETDPTDGKRFNVTRGQYVIQSVLWDTSPFTPVGTYLAPELRANDHAVIYISPAFTVAAQ